MQQWIKLALSITIILSFPIFAIDEKLSLDLPEIYITAKDLSKTFITIKEQVILDTLVTTQSNISRFNKPLFYKLGTANLQSFIPNSLPEAYTRISGELGLPNHFIASLRHSFHFNTIPYVLDLRAYNSAIDFQAEPINDLSVLAAASWLQPSGNSIDSILSFRNKKLGASEWNALSLGGAMQHIFLDVPIDSGLLIDYTGYNSFAGQSAGAISAVQLNSKMTTQGWFNMHYFSTQALLFNASAKSTLALRILAKENETSLYHVGFSFWNTAIAFDLGYKQTWLITGNATTYLNLTSHRDFLDPTEGTNTPFYEINPNSEPAFPYFAASYGQHKLSLSKEIVAGWEIYTTLYDQYRALMDLDNDGYFAYENMGKMIVYGGKANAEFLISSNLQLTGTINLPLFSNQTYNQWNPFLKTKLAYQPAKNTTIDINMSYFLTEVSNPGQNKPNFFDAAINGSYQADNQLRIYSSLLNIFSSGSVLYRSSVDHKRGDLTLLIGVEWNL